MRESKVEKIIESFKKKLDELERSSKVAVVIELEYKNVMK